MEHKKLDEGTYKEIKKFLSDMEKEYGYDYYMMGEELAYHLLNSFMRDVMYLDPSDRGDVPEEVKIFFKGFKKSVDEFYSKYRRVVEKEIKEKNIMKITIQEETKIIQEDQEITLEPGDQIEVLKEDLRSISDLGYYTREVITDDFERLGPGSEEKVGELMGNRLAVSLKEVHWNMTSEGTNTFVLSNAKEFTRSFVKGLTKSLLRSLG